MYVILWQFEVLPGREAEFETLYGPEGGWALLFRQFDGFGGTELLHDVHHRNWYVTIDRWRSRESYETARRESEQHYREIDARGAELTRHETRLGAFEEVRQQI